MDAGLFTRALENLVGNAIRYTEQKGKITMEAHRQDDSVLLSITDTGIGIKVSDQERVFKEFEQVDSSYGRQQHGTGLGLNLAKKIVEAHGGSIQVKSAAMKGTEFMVRLPAAPAGELT